MVTKRMNKNNNIFSLTQMMKKFSIVSPSLFSFKWKERRWHCLGVEHKVWNGDPYLYCITKNDIKRTQCIEKGENRDQWLFHTTHWTGGFATDYEGKLSFLNASNLNIEEGQDKKLNVAHVSYFDWHFAGVQNKRNLSLWLILSHSTWRL